MTQPICESVAGDHDFLNSFPPLVPKAASDANL